MEESGDELRETPAALLWGGSYLLNDAGVFIDGYKYLIDHNAKDEVIRVFRSELLLFALNDGVRPDVRALRDGESWESPPSPCIMASPAADEAAVNVLGAAPSRGSTFQREVYDRQFDDLLRTRGWSNVEVTRTPDPRTPGYVRPKETPPGTTTSKVVGKFNGGGHKLRPSLLHFGHYASGLPDILSSAVDEEPAGNYSFGTVLHEVRASLVENLGAVFGGGANIQLTIRAPEGQALRQYERLAADSTLPVCATQSEALIDPSTGLLRRGEGIESEVRVNAYTLAELLVYHTPLFEFADIQRYHQSRQRPNAASRQRWPNAASWRPRQVLSTNTVDFFFQLMARLQEVTSAERYNPSLIVDMVICKPLLHETSGGGTSCPGGGLHGMDGSGKCPHCPDYLTDGDGKLRSRWNFGFNGLPKTIRQIIAGYALGPDGGRRDKVASFAVGEAIKEFCKPLAGRFQFNAVKVRRAQHSAALQLLGMQSKAAWEVLGLLCIPFNQFDGVADPPYYSGDDAHVIGLVMGKCAHTLLHTHTHSHMHSFIVVSCGGLSETAALVLLQSPRRLRRSRGGAENV